MLPTFTPKSSPKLLEDETNVHLLRLQCGTDGTKILPALKWPNALMGRFRKAAGMLAEATYQSNKLDHLIFGLGVNANIEMTRLPKELWGLSTSLSHELGREIDRTMLARRIIEEVDRSYRDFESGHENQLLEEVIATVLDSQEKGESDDR